MKPISLSASCFVIIFTLFAGLGQASASPVLVKEVGTSSGMGVGSLTLPVSTSAQNYFAGLQLIDVNNSATQLLAYCIDPFQWSPTSNVSYNVSTDFNTFFGAKATQIGELYSLFYTSTLNSNVNAAGFQLALWELVADTSVNLSAGLVKTDSATNASVKAEAQTMLNALNGNVITAQQFTYTIYTSATNQDYLVATPVTQVPEPSVLGLFMLALTSALVMRRRARD